MNDIVRASRKTDKEEEKREKKKKLCISWNDIGETVRRHKSGLLNDFMSTIAVSIDSWTRYSRDLEKTTRNALLIRQFKIIFENHISQQ